LKTDKLKATTDPVFNTVWFSILRRVNAKRIENWSVAGRAKGSFTAHVDSPDHLTVTGPEITGMRRISKTDFARIFWVWDDYIKGTMGRQELTKLSQNTTYVISILHWEKENSK